MKNNKKTTFIYKNLLIITVIIAIFGASCGPIKRHAMLVKRFPHVHHQDTVKMIDTITVEIPVVEVDTTFLIDSFYVKLLDTITIEKDRLKVKMYAVHDSIFIEAKCDTFIVEKIIVRKIPIRYYVEKDGREWQTYLGWSLGILLFLILLYFVYKMLKLFK